MKFYLCFIFFAIGVCGDEVQDITASNAEKVVDKVVADDLNIASGNINTDTKYFRGKDGEYNYHGGNYNYGGNRFFGGKEGTKYFRGTDGEYNYYGGNNNYGGNRFFGGNEESKYFRGKDGEYNYYGVNYNNGGNRFFGGNEGNKYFRGKDGESNYYGGNKFFGGNDEEILFNRKHAEDLFKAREDRRFRFDDGNPDVRGRIQRPCQVYDTFCIRKFFAEHSHCKISGRAVPDPLFRAQTTFNVPSVNVSATLINTEYSGLKNGRIAEFYIDNVTDNLVIALDFDSVSFFSNNVNVKYYHRGKEPTVLSDFASATFVKLTITVVIPHIKDLRLERAEISTYASEPIPPFVSGPRIGLSTDPEVLLQFAGILTGAVLDTQETLLTEGNFFAITFIQYNICDFGLKDI